ncbi:hypothetical protein [Geopseudomonas aromaticivorans]
MMIAKDFLILRDILPGGSRSYTVPRKPIYVCTLVSVEKFEASGHALQQFKTVHIEDAQHDWSWYDGQLRYFPGSHEPADVVVVYEVSEVFFCTECGAPSPVMGEVCDDCRQPPDVAG